jgi:hypothetical protein
MDHLKNTAAFEKHLLNVRGVFATTAKGAWGIKYLLRKDWMS